MLLFNTYLITRRNKMKKFKSEVPSPNTPTSNNKNDSANKGGSAENLLLNNNFSDQRVEESKSHSRRNQLIVTTPEVMSE